MSDNPKMNGSPIRRPFKKDLPPVKNVRPEDKVNEIAKQLQVQTIKYLTDSEKAVARAKRIAEDYLSSHNPFADADFILSQSCFNACSNDCILVSSVSSFRSM